MLIKINRICSPKKTNIISTVYFCEIVIISKKSGDYGAFENVSFHDYMQKFTSLEIVHKIIFTFQYWLRKKSIFDKSTAQN